MFFLPFFSTKRVCNDRMITDDSGQLMHVLLDKRPVESKHGLLMWLHVTAVCTVSYTKLDD